MKKVYVFATLLLMAGMAVGQNPYGIQSKQSGFKDVTTMTNTVNAWKLFPSGNICSPKTISVGSIDASAWCVGTDKYTYMFDKVSHSWQRTNMGTSALYLIVKDVTNVYSLQSVAHCGVHGGIQFYGFFRWIGSWHEQNSTACASQGNIGTDDVVESIGWDLNNNEPALFQSTDEGSSWTLIDDGFIFTALNDKAMGCAIDSTHGVWTGIVGNPLYGFGLLPSGTAAGCIYANNTGVLMAWNTAGTVYAMPQENFGSWQTVTGISAGMISGNKRFWIFGQDTSGRAYHWNVHAPGASATYGGTWNPNNGCPSPGQICNPSTTHHLKAQLRFSSGHGIDGRLADVTQLWNSSFTLTSQDYNPLCDPFIGLSGDTECQMVMDANAECNQSNAFINSNAVPISSGNMAIDDTAYSFHWADSGGADLIGAPTEGVWTAWSQNVVTDVCPIGTTTSCPMPSPENSVFSCGFGNAQQSISCYDQVMGGFSLHNIGGDAPYTSYDVYTVWQLPDGTQFKECLGTSDEPDIFWFQNYAALPACR